MSDPGIYIYDIYKHVTMEFYKVAFFAVACLAYVGK